MISGVTFADTWTVDDDGMIGLDQTLLIADQSKDSEDNCSSPLNDEIILKTEKLVQEGTWDIARHYPLRQREVRYVKISIHVVRYSDGTGGIFPETRIQEEIDNLNNHVISTGLFFFQYGDIIYLDSDEFKSMYPNLPPIDIYDDLLPVMKDIIIDTFLASKEEL